LENCVNIYKEKEDTFASYCDSYSKIQNLVESVFGREFLELALHRSGKQMLGRVLNRIWLVKDGNSRRVARKLYKIMPASKDERNSNMGYSNTHTGIFQAQGLRSVNPEERIHLRVCLINACNRYFLRCKKAIVDVMAVVKDPSKHAAVKAFITKGHQLKFAGYSLLLDLGLRYKQLSSIKSRVVQILNLR
jgi:hypothetical protein